MVLLLVFKSDGSSPVTFATSLSNNLFMEPSCMVESTSIALAANEAFFTNEIISEACASRSIKYSDRRLAFLDKFLKSSTECCSNKLAGSSPSGKNRKLISVPSVIDGKTFFSAPHAAPLPASSPSKQKVI